MGPTFKSLEAALVILIGQDLIAQQKSVQLTAALTASAWVDRVGVKKGGQDLLATREHVTLVAWNMVPAKMASVNVTRAGMESTAQLKAARDSVTAMEDAHWIKMDGIVCASRAGGEQDVMLPWKLCALTVRTMKEMA